jgi:tetratricopeptide (TPR) repeat protein
MSKRKLMVIPLIILSCVVLGAVLYNLPPIQERLAWRIDTLKTRIQYALNPPDEAIFVPVETAATTPQVDPPTPSPTTPPPTATETLPPEVDTPTPEPSSTPTITPTPLPESVALDGVVYVDQHNRWNYCGPANLTMALKFWGWPGSRDDVARVVKPGVQDPDLDLIQQGFWDKNVMPYELADFVTYETELSVVLRYGGDLDLVRRLVAGGFPVLIEKGYYEADYTGKVAWLGHYLFTTGYDDAAKEFIVQDAYLRPGEDRRVEYDIYMEGWRSFNYLFMVVYPPEREAEVFELFGPYSDEGWAKQRALETAEREAQELSGNDAFFAWFNQGTSLVQIDRFNRAAEAAVAYDQAFALYAQLGDDDTQRPYRIMWYQTGPYIAYFYSGRYQDVINLANTTLYETVSDPTLEESLYWRGMAYWALERTDEAIADFRETVRLNPNFSPGWYMLEQLGVGP